MVRGTTLFICTKCKKLFLAPDIEYGAMVYSRPMPCKRCGSIRTFPVVQPAYYPMYKSIWKTMEKECSPERLYFMCRRSYTSTADEYILQVPMNIYFIRPGSYTSFGK